jgi:hypothetical protein
MEAALRESSAEGITGKDVHREWRDGMIAQGRTVAPERMNWDTLSEQDKELDERIASRLSGKASAEGWHKWPDEKPPELEVVLVCPWPNAIIYLALTEKDKWLSWNDGWKPLDMWPNDLYWQPLPSLPHPASPTSAEGCTCKPIPINRPDGSHDIDFDLDPNCPKCFPASQPKEHEFCMGCGHHINQCSCQPKERRELGEEPICTCAIYPDEPCLVHPRPAPPKEIRNCNNCKYEHTSSADLPCRDCMDMILGRVLDRPTHWEARPAPAQEIVVDGAIEAAESIDDDAPLQEGRRELGRLEAIQKGDIMVRGDKSEAVNGLAGRTVEDIDHRPLGNEGVLHVYRPAPAQGEEYEGHDPAFVEWWSGHENKMPCSIFEATEKAYKSGKIHSLAALRQARPFVYRYWGKMDAQEIADHGKEVNAALSAIDAALGKTNGDTTQSEEQ